MYFSKNSNLILVQYDFGIGTTTVGAFNKKIPSTPLTQMKTRVGVPVRCQFYNPNLINDLLNLDKSLPSLTQDKVISVLLNGSNAFDNRTNRKILIRT